MQDSIARAGSDWKDGFLFLGNQLALDFLNTRPLQDGEFQELLTDFEALVRWLAAAGVLAPGEAAKLRQRWRESPHARRVLERARDLRERLRKEVVAWEAGAAVHVPTISELNRLMAEHPMRTRLRVSREGVTAESWFAMERPQDLLAPVAHAAAMLFSQAKRERVRQCGNCVLHFQDTSKKGTRRWCSMQLCGNRIKVAAYAARQRKH